MPATFEEDDTPFDPDKDKENGADDTNDDGKVPCPECGNRYMPGGLKRHITVSHGNGQVANAPKSGGTKRGIDIAVTGKKFQQSASLLVAMACTKCATILYNDAENDWQAISEFCSDRPKLRKQVQDMLSISDFMLLIGALGGTAQKMVAHHSIGAKLPFGFANEDGPHDGHDPKADMAAFIMAIPEEERNALINEALNNYASANNGS